MESIKRVLKLIFLVPIVFINNFQQYKKLSEAKQVEVSYFKWICGVIISFPLILLLHIFLIILKQFVSLALLLKYKSKFGGILKGQDSNFIQEYPRPVIIESLFTIESNKSPQEFYKMVREHINKSLKSKLAFNPKICGSVNKFLGYPFIIRDEITIDECISELQKTEGETITKADLLKINEEASSEPLPKNNKGFWKVLIGTQPVDWDESSNKDDLKIYPIKLRLSHCVGDGLHVLTGIFALFGDKQNDVGSKEAKPPNESLSRRLLDFFWNFVEIIIYFFPFISMLLVNSLLVTSTPHNILHGKKLSGRKFMCLSRKASCNHLEIAKNIKNRYSDVPLSAVFATAFSASLAEYYQKNASEVPKCITCEVAVAPGAVNLLNLTPNSVAKSKIACTNNFGFYTAKLPMLVETKHDHINLVKMLRNNAKNSKQIHDSGESETYRRIVAIMTPNMPIFFCRFFTKVSYDVHGAITNIPGPSRITVMGGNLLKNLFFWCPHYDSMGMGLAINTYGVNLQMTLNIDAALVPEREQVQQILDDVYKYIELLDEATTKDTENE